MNKERLIELIALKEKIETKVFQDNVMKPLFAELDSLGKAYEQNSLRELATLKGKVYGLKFLIKILKNNEIEIKNLKDELSV